MTNPPTSYTTSWDTTVSTLNSPARTRRYRHFT